MTGTSGFYRSFWEPDVQTDSAFVQTCDPQCVLSFAEANSSCFTRTPAKPEKTIVTRRWTTPSRSDSSTQGWIQYQEYQNPWALPVYKGLLPICTKWDTFHFTLCNTFHNNMSKSWITIIMGTQIQSGVIWEQRKPKSANRCLWWASIHPYRVLAC